MRGAHRLAVRVGMAMVTALVAGALMATPSGAATFVYVGNAESNEVYVLQLNPQNGDLTVIEKTPIPGIEKPGDLDADGAEPRSPHPLRRHARRAEDRGGLRHRSVDRHAQVRCGRSARRQPGVHLDRSHRPLSPGRVYRATG